MLPHFASAGTQATLALLVFALSFAYEDGATLLAATLAATGRLDIRFGFASAFFGIWIGDMGLYWLGATVGRRAAASPWVSRLVSSHALAQAESWFRDRGPITIVMSRFLPGSRLPLYVAAGALKFPARLFCAVTGICSAIWVAVIFGALHFAPGLSFASGKKTALLVTALLAGPWLAGKLIVHTVRQTRLFLTSRIWSRRRSGCLTMPQEFPVQ